MVINALSNIKILMFTLIALSTVITVLVPISASKCSGDPSGKVAWRRYQPAVFCSCVVWLTLLFLISANEGPEFGASITN